MEKSNPKLTGLSNAFGDYRPCGLYTNDPDLWQMWNTYCAITDNSNPPLYKMRDLDEWCEGIEPTELIRSAIFSSHFDFKDDFYSYDGTGNLYTYANEMDFLNERDRKEELVEWICEHKAIPGYCNNLSDNGNPMYYFNADVCANDFAWLYFDSDSEEVLLELGVRDADEIDWVEEDWDKLAGRVCAARKA